MINNSQPDDKAFVIAAAVLVFLVTGHFLSLHLPLDF